MRLNIFWRICCLSNIISLLTIGSAAASPPELVMRKPDPLVATYALYVPQSLIIGEIRNLAGIPELVVDPARHLSRAARRDIPYLVVPVGAILGWESRSGSRPVMRINEGQVQRVARSQLSGLTRIAPRQKLVRPQFPRGIRLNSPRAGRSSAR